MIDTQAALRALYPAPKTRALAKQLDRLDAHCRKFVALSPFLVLATSGKDGRVDASPRGGAPGFVRVLDDNTLHLPDALGNNRLDSYGNIVDTGKCGMIFFIPGMDETLRINGDARLRDEPELLRQFPHERHPPRIVVEIDVEEAYLHCPKALMRSRLWSGEHRIERALFPSLGQMIKDQSGSAEPVESQQAALARYVTEL
ncbi:MAG: pyridoxamine 5'-phosphate oxidase family protein [Burkholderiales bacterium]|nr:pyridoxamine 5'-phosphate oxidase family protein [Burkholderiales bacterium]